MLLMLAYLAAQQAEVLAIHTALEVGKYCGQMNVDFWDGGRWKDEVAKQHILVMTPQILLNILRHGFIAVRAPAGCSV